LALKVSDENRVRSKKVKQWYYNFCASLAVRENDGASSLDRVNETYSE
jgi:hypothetical protein